MSLAVGWHIIIKDKLRPMPKHGFNIALRPLKVEGSLGRTAQDGHLDSHTAPELQLQHNEDTDVTESYSSVSCMFSYFGVIHWTDMDHTIFNVLRTTPENDSNRQNIDRWSLTVEKEEEEE